MFEDPVHDIDRCRDRVFFRADRRVCKCRSWDAGPGARPCEFGIGIARRRGGGEGKGAEGKIKAPTPCGCQVIVCTSFSMVPSACGWAWTGVGRAPGGRFACLRAALLVGSCIVGHDGGESGLRRILKHGR